MQTDKKTQAITSLFHKQIKRDPKIRNAALLVYSGRHDIHLNLAGGPGENGVPAPGQPHYMASVGKLFTSTIVAILHEQGKLSFTDPICSVLDDDLIEGLHRYKGKDYSRQLQIRHLLNQTSGLPDNFYPLFDKLLNDPGLEITPREAVLWARDHLKPQAVPGRRTCYTDTNYHLLGLIVERVCGEPFHEVLKRLIFDPLGMKHAYMLHRSRPAEDSPFPEAGFYHGQTRLNALTGFAGIDYAGGGVVAPMEDLLLFLKALTAHRLVTENTLEQMKNDKARLNPGFDYGYGIWQIRPIPLLLPSKYRSWGVLGATGAFMFYHPALDTCLIGTFNHTAWQRKCVRFMFKVIDKLRK